ncbi:Cullin binding-domain-containing protein [Phlebopus sp. FC_14]|nr:Cullin binding-domain-containing protein [Phlebopus sp. FC_14]
MCDAAIMKRAYGSTVQLYWSSRSQNVLHWSLGVHDVPHILNMPPKRKRVEADTAESSTQATGTRKSTRTTRGKGPTTQDPGNPSSSYNPANDIEKTKGTATKAAASKAGGSKGRGSRTTKASLNDDKPTNSTNVQQHDDGSQETKESFTPAKEEYSRQRSQALFKSFADPDDSNVIGPEGLEKLCTEAGIPLEGAQSLLMAWQFKAHELGKFGREEWLQGTDVLWISSLSVLALALRELDDLLIHNKEPLSRPAKSIPSKKRDDRQEPYNRSRYWQYASDRKAAFTELYQFCFALAKPQQSRNLDIETAIALWSVLLVPRHPIAAEMVEFLNENGSYRGANKDIWSMVLEFCRTINSTLDNYEADGAWPTMLDDFVSWKRSKMASTEPVPVADE